MTIDIQHLKQWEGKTESCDDLISPNPIAALAATLGNEARMQAPAGELPPLWHWLYCLPLAPRQQLDSDGHPVRGGFLPPVPLPRRMWAGGRLTFLRPLRVGEAIERTSRVVNVTAKEGRSGSLVFLLVRHELGNSEGPAIVEEQDIVYRERPSGLAPAAKPAPAPTQSLWEERIHPDEVLLFRYSALTFNGHRIHYSRNYATQEEGYPGLVVHGPLIATLLLDLLARRMPLARVASFSFRAVHPLFDTGDFYLCGSPSKDGRTVELWARDENGRLAMQAQAVLAAATPINP